MPLVPMVELLSQARRGGYAVCYCESWNLESLQAVIEAAEELNSPVIAGFNGGFLMHPNRPERVGESRADRPRARSGIQRSDG